MDEKLPHVVSCSIQQVCVLFQQVKCRFFFCWILETGHFIAKFCSFNTYPILDQFSRSSGKKSHNQLPIVRGMRDRNTHSAHRLNWVKSLKFIEPPSDYRTRFYFFSWLPVRTWFCSMLRKKSVCRLCACEIAQQLACLFYYLIRLINRRNWFLRWTDC